MIMLTIKAMLTNLFPKQVLYYRAFRTLIRNEQSYLHSTGWLRSLQEERPVDKDGIEMPWINYPIIKILERRLTKNLELFEFGSGYSTPFYARLTKHVTSVEYSDVWLQIVQGIVPENVTLIHKEKDVDGEYCRAIRSAGERYDVVVVDGPDRVNCIKQCIESLTSTGVILLDDSGRETYLEGIDYAIAKGFRSLEIEGLKPYSSKLARTTILYRRDNCLNL